ncbi:MAG: radical SAM protein [Pseudomonadota bacterium]
MGLTLLGGMLSRYGHEVKVLDYSFLKTRKKFLRVPSIAEVISQFDPEVIGLSVFTYLYDDCNDALKEISSSSGAPVILGGPHISVFPEDFAGDDRVSYIVRGEAENVILDLVDSAIRQPAPKRINCPLPAAQDIPPIDLDIAYGSRCLKEYQIQLSRGCPFNCSFCSVHLINGREVRARDIKLCVDQIREAKESYPDIRLVSITDDCPNFNKERFKEFLVMFSESKIYCELAIDNVRADLVDEEMIGLYKKAGGRNICLGVESGNQEVFNSAHKGESLEAIIQAAELVHKYELRLGLCFVVGLPGDNISRNRDSIELAKKMNPDYIYWNMCTPWPDTEMHGWFKKNGTILDVRNFSTLVDQRFNFGNPPAFSPDFTQDERTKAWLTANLETCAVPVLLWGNLAYVPLILLRMIRLAIRYGIWKQFYRYFRILLFQKIFSTKAFGGWLRQ